MTLIARARLGLTRDAAAPAVPQRSTATPPPRSAIQPGCVTLFRAQQPIWLRLREVRDEEAAGSNPVTPTSIPAGQRPYPFRGGAFGLARTATKYATVLIGRTPPAGAALRWWPSSWRSHVSPACEQSVSSGDLNLKCTRRECQWLATPSRLRQSNRHRVRQADETGRWPAMPRHAAVFEDGTVNVRDERGIA
jgi:hypothetical protein